MASVLGAVQIQFMYVHLFIGFHHHPINLGEKDACLAVPGSRFKLQLNQFFKTHNVATENTVSKAAPGSMKKRKAIENVKAAVTISDATRPPARRRNS